MSLHKPSVLDGSDTKERVDRPGGCGRYLVLGYGNPGREDDGLGPTAAAAIEADGWANVTVLSNYQLVPEDVFEIANADVVWFVDASRSGGEPFEVIALPPSDAISFASHSATPQELLALTAQYFGRRPKAHMLAIRGYRFAFREGLSGRAGRNLEQALVFLRRSIGGVDEALRLHHTPKEAE
ncbi:MAG TPA: hydrogenase maturation protease [Acidobacteriaceae bacterium]|nr:hydrogenase maturation protease [Acidobacteriaceae bacterium]